MDLFGLQTAAGNNQQVVVAGRERDMAYFGACEIELHSSDVLYA